MVPRACKPFALFVKEHVAAHKGAGRDVWRQEMKRLGRLWQSLPQQEKEKYQIKSGGEFANQRAVMQQHGLTCRKARAAAVEVKPDVEATNEQCQPQPLLIGEYKVATDGLDSPSCQKLGEGSHGSVFLCLDQFHRCCAVKVFKRSDVLADVKHEASVLKRLQTELGQDLTGFFLAFGMWSPEHPHTRSWSWSALGPIYGPCSRNMVHFAWMIAEPLVCS